MLQLSNKDLAEIFAPDMHRLSPGWLITWYMEQELVSYEFLWENDINFLIKMGSTFNSPYIFN